jgi:hypothetical protein
MKARNRRNNWDARKNGKPETGETTGTPERTET